MKSVFWIITSVKLILQSIFYMWFIRIIIAVILFQLIYLQSLKAQTISISGVVTDPKGNPIGSVSVKIKNSNTGTSTDTLGVFNIKVKPNTTLILSAIGYGDTSLITGKKANIYVVLQPLAKSLKEVVVSGASQTTKLPAPDEATREEIIASTFENYLRGAMFSNGTFVSSSYNPAVRGGAGLTRLSISGFGALNTINSGAMLPVIEHKEDTKGSRYLLNTYAKGVAIDPNNNVVSDSTSMFNYDKIDGQLMIAKDAKNYLEVDKDKVVGFALKTEDTSFIFLNVPILSKTNYFLLIANGPKYSAYKAIRAKFVKSNYQSNGLVETGNDYDEYVDKQTYYWVNERDSTAGFFELKKKSIKEVFSAEKEKTEAYFTKHKYDDIDDSFVKGLIRYLNQ